MSMAIWTVKPDLEYMAKASANTAVSHMGIEYTEIGDDFVSGRMPSCEMNARFSLLASSTVAHLWCWLKRLAAWPLTAA